MEDVSSSSRGWQSRSHAAKRSAATNEAVCASVFRAASAGLCDLVEELISCKAEANIQQDSDGCTPLHKAVLKGHIEVAKLLIEYRGLINAASMDNDTPLLASIRSGGFDITVFLMQGGASIYHVNVDGNSPLHVAAAYGRLAQAKLLCDSGAMVNMKNYVGRTPLHVATFTKQIDIMQLLLYLGATVNLPSKAGQTPLHVAAWVGSLPAVKLLIDHSARLEQAIRLCAENDEGSQVGETSLHVAVRKGYHNVAVKLLQASASLQAVTQQGFHPLHVACSAGHQRLVELLCKMRSQVEARVHFKSASPLHMVAHVGYESIAKSLLNFYCDVNIADDNGATSLYVACACGHSEMVKLLLNRAARIDQCMNTGATPLHAASVHGRGQLVKFLLNRAAQIDLCMKNGYQSICSAARVGHAKIVDVLAERRANIHMKRKDGSVVLHGASRYGHAEIAALLLEHRAHINSTDGDGSTPLACSSTHGHFEVSNLLIQRRALLSCMDRDGSTPLHSAALNGYVDVAKLLLEHNADVHSKTKSGCTPLHSAAVGGHCSLIDTLLDRNALIDSFTAGLQTPADYASFAKKTDVLEHLEFISRPDAVLEGNGSPSSMGISAMANYVSGHEEVKKRSRSVKALALGAGAERVSCALEEILGVPLEYTVVHTSAVDVYEQPSIEASAVAMLQPGEKVFGFPGGAWLRLVKTRNAVWTPGFLLWVLVDGVALGLGPLLQATWATANATHWPNHSLTVCWPGLIRTDVMYRVRWRILERFKNQYSESSKHEDVNQPSIALTGVPEGLSVSLLVTAQFTCGRSQDVPVCVSGHEAVFAPPCQSCN